MPFWSGEVSALAARLGTDLDGLTAAQAQAALARRRLVRHHRHGTASWARLLVSQFSNPITLVLVGATIISMLVGDMADGAIILAIIVASGSLGFWQERRADTEVAALLATVQVSVPVLRSGREVKVPVAEILPGDVVPVRAGGVVPGDCRLITSENLLVDESTLSGESFPVEKDASAAVGPTVVLAQRRNSLFLGTHVVSGTGLAIVALAGRDTAFGRVTSDLEKVRVTTAFSAGTRRFGSFLIITMAVLTAFMLTVNLVLGRPVIESVLFALALAVGLSPQMLPAIVAVSLSAGARRLARARVIVKRLDAIEDLGALTVLCTDKTGTLTTGLVELDAPLDLGGHVSAEVLDLAAQNAGLQRGFENPIDTAILQRRALPRDARSLDELPYDFTRRMLSVLVDRDGPTLITKGAVRNVLERCVEADLGASTVPIEQVRDEVIARFEALGARGHRVLAIATRRLPQGTGRVTLADEQGLVLRGLLVLRDPPKVDAASAVAKLAELGVGVRLITGDNRHVAAAAAEAVGIRGEAVMIGAEIDAADDAELRRRVRDAVVFAEVEPVQKSRIVRALRDEGETVGYLGDGINDAAALHAADAGISINTAVDVAKQAAAIVLLDKQLGVIVEGVRLGRETFANTLKYVRVTTSANFGNMLSMAVASLFLPFLPLLPRQILLLNFLSDIPAMTIASDAVDAELARRPGRWDIAGIRRFMIVFGLLSTVFDLATFGVLVLGFGADQTLFHSAWFIESTLTELVVLLSLRTARPIWRSRPGRGLLIASGAVAAITLLLAYLPPAAEALGLVPVPAAVILTLVALTAVYLVANETLKSKFLTDPIMLPGQDSPR